MERKLLSEFSMEKELYMSDLDFRAPFMRSHLFPENVSKSFSKYFGAQLNSRPYKTSFKISNYEHLLLKVPIRDQE